MRIEQFDANPIAEVPFLNAGRTPGGFYKDRLPIHLARVDRLPDGVSAMIATADLQGRELLRRDARQPPRLLGEILPRWLVNEILPSVSSRKKNINSFSMGVLLAGDFYTVPALDKRGGTGDVSSVWQAFADEFKWVAGVAGNHDQFEDGGLRPRRLAKGAKYLDEHIAQIDGLRIAGLSGIIGSPDRPHRRTEDEYLFALECLIEQKPDVIVTHDGPEGLEAGQRGSSRARELFEETPVSLLVRGHAHWDNPFCTLSGGTQVLNVDARVVILIDGGE
jgi:Icc protein